MERVSLTLRKNTLKDEPNNPEDNYQSARQNVSFKFAKQSSKKFLSNKLGDNEKGSGTTNKEIVYSVEGKEIKSSVPKQEKKQLVIQPIPKNVWRHPQRESCNANQNDQDTSNNDNAIREMAVKELLKETAIQNEKWENREFDNVTITIPLVMQNKIPEGFETDSNLNVELRPPESSLKDYENVPIDEFGSALLRGLGCKPGDPIGNKNKKFIKPIEAVQRSKGLGLGADRRPSKNATIAQGKDELKMVIGAYVRIVQGIHQDCYGQVEGFNESRVIICLNDENKNVSLPLLYAEVISKKEHDKEAKVLNKRSYDKYKREHELKSSRSSRNEYSNAVEDSEMRDSEKSHSSSKLDRQENNIHTSSNRKHYNDDQKSSKHHKKRKHSKERRLKENASGKESPKQQANWVCPQIRVRFIDNEYKDGKYFNEKMVVEDVLSPECCICKTENRRYLEDISPAMLETVVPRSEPGYVMIVEGKYKGQLGYILKRDKANCIAAVQFLSDRDKVKKLSYDSICEYVGDISHFD